MSLSTLLEPHFPYAKTPPAKKDRWHWDSNWICIANNFSLHLLHEVLGNYASSSKSLPNAVSKVQEMYPNVFQTETFASGKTARKIGLLIQEPEIKMWSVDFDHSRYVHVMEPLCIIATFDYVDGWKDFYLPWVIYVSWIKTSAKLNLSPKCFEVGKWKMK